MEPIEEQELNYLRISLYGIEMKVISERIEKSVTTTTNALLHGIGSKDTWDRLRILVKQILGEKSKKAKVS